MSIPLLALSLLLAVSVRGSSKTHLHRPQAPHIIYVLADDMGWNDVSYHGSDQIPTPNIDSLAYNGVILNRHYVQPLCTPSRASLMSGKYPIHTGIHTALAPSDKAGLSLTEKILPEYLKDLGYATHLVGKWHLGFYKKEFTPLMRGFDSHFGYWTGAISYYDHICEDVWPVPPNQYLFSGHDMRRNYSSAWDVVGQYATDLFTQEALNLIDNHPPDKPMFLYLSHLAVHAGNQGKWLEAPQDEINRFSYISNPNRRTYAAMVSKLDQSIGAVVDALDKKDMLTNSIIVFVSDNGAPNFGLFNNWGSNYPYRGHKATLWEGAIRTPALIWSPLIAKPSRVSTGFMHITDWLPTLLHAAGYNIDFLKHKDMDGQNLWPTISRGVRSPREGLVLDIDRKNKMSGVIINRFKFINGATLPKYEPEASRFLNFDSITSPREPRYGMEEISTSPAWKALHKFSRDPQLGYKIKNLRQEATVFCDHNLSKVVNCTGRPCLFDLRTDPCEQDNVADSFPGFVSQIQELLRLYELGSVPDLLLYQDLVSNPVFYNGTWSIWDS